MAGTKEAAELTPGIETTQTQRVDIAGNVIVWTQMRDTVTGAVHSYTTILHRSQPAQVAPGESAEALYWGDDRDAFDEGLED